jgi:glycosyltransferase involved in cell wall biosynthesis
VAHYDIDPDKITVVQEAASPELSPKLPEDAEGARHRYGLPDRFLIHVGTIEPRKNLTRLLEALHRLRREGAVIPLVVVGGKGWLSEDFYRRLEELAIGDTVLFLGYVPSADLPYLYSAATAAVMPSVYEGFGLPVLEAMACGTPVVCSSASSLPEVGGEAARYFDPYDVAAMAEAIAVVWNDAELRGDMRRRGLEQATRFSWARAAEETLAVYERVLASGS